MTVTEAAAVALALAYLVLAIRQNPWCWLAALGSAALYSVVLFDAQLYLMAALQGFYIVMAVYGWRQWRGGGSTTGLASAEGAASHATDDPTTTGPGAVRNAPAPLPVTRLPAARHGLLLAAVAGLTAVSATALAETTSAALPALDAAITWGSIAATWLTTRKILENWYYWFVIDVASVGVYLDRGLYATAALFAVYVVLVVVGYRRWAATMTA